MIAILSREYLEGFRRLLEKDGDITMVAHYPSLRQAARGADRYPQSVFVIGPGAEVTSAAWDRAPLSRSVVVTPTPRDGRFPRGVTEIPMELTGNTLRAAIRKCEMLPRSRLVADSRGAKPPDRGSDESLRHSSRIGQREAVARPSPGPDRSGLLHDPAADLTEPRAKGIPS